MINTNIKQITFTAVTVLLLSACGGGSSTSSFPDDVKVPACGTAVDNGKAVAADVTGKTIQKGETGTEVVRIWHDPDGTKTACMITGEATII